MWIFRKRWQLEKNAQVRLCICHRMGSLRLLYSVNVTKIFKVTNLKRQYFENGESYRKKCVTWLVEVDIRHRMAPLWMLNYVTLTFIFMMTLFCYALAINKCVGSGFASNRTTPALELLMLIISLYINANQVATRFMREWNF